MKRIILLTTILLSALSLSAKTGTWSSTALGKSVTYKATDSSKAAKDFSGKYMTVVYLENLACEKIGQNSNAEDVAWLLAQGYRVIELDYGKDANAVSPNLNMDIMAINSQINKGSFCGYSNISTDRAYVLFEGYRIQRDVSYYLDDPTVYNYPDAYKTMTGDSLYMDIAYPANPSKAVPTILSFSYSNSYAGTANEGYVKKYQHKRAFLGYTWAMFNDTMLEGAPGQGMAWAIADHPKYCDWGRGNRANGSQKEFGAIEVNPDAARKVKAAVRTVRGFGKTVSLGDDVALYGFSRGSTAASLAVGSEPFSDWLDTDRMPKAYVTEGSEIQAAVLGPGVFDYSLMPTTTNEYKHMQTYCNSTSSATTAWSEQGGAKAAVSGSVPTFFFYNSDDDANYATQAQNLMKIYDASKSTYELMKDYGTGHSVPQTKGQIEQIYNFLTKYLHSGITGLKGVKKDSGKKKKRAFSADGINYSGKSPKGRHVIIKAALPLA